MADVKTLFDEMGGYDTIRKVHKIFYDKIYADAWMGQFFREIDQTHIENQQTDFMVAAMGGPEKYYGAFPIPAHQHINITNELFNYRHDLLKASLSEAGLSEALSEKWLKIDGAFRTGLVKKSILDCKGRYKTDPIVDFQVPHKKNAA